MIKPQSPEAGEWKVNEGRNKKLTFKPTFDYLLKKYTKVGPKDWAMKRPRSPMRQERWERLKQTKLEAKGKGIWEEGYGPRFAQPSHFAHPFGHPSASSSMGFLVNQMQWCPPLMMPTYPIWDPYRQIWVNYPLMMLMTPWGLGAPRQPVFERLELPMNDRVDSSSGQQSVEPINEEKPILKGEIERTITNDVIQIGTSQVKLGGEFNGPVIIDDQVDTVMEDVTPDREVEKANKVVDSKYLQPRWCPPGLTRTQKRKLQQLRLADMREKEREKQRDELFNEIKPMTLPEQEWRWKEAPQCSTAEPATDG
jgi:hypothetical protein